MTLKEIAALANVSPSTVSRVLRKDGEKYASKEVRDRIWKIVQETQYSPNVNAQKLKMNRETTIRTTEILDRLKLIREELVSMRKELDYLT